MPKRSKKKLAKTITIDFVKEISEVKEDIFSNLVKAYTAAANHKQEYEQLRREHELTQSEVAELKKTVAILQGQRTECRYVSDDKAEEEVYHYLSQLKKENIKVVSVIEIAEKVNLPIDQIERTMDKLKSKGIKEV